MDPLNTPESHHIRPDVQDGEHFRLLVESVQDYGIFMLDRQGRIASWNAGAERINGYSADEVLGKHFKIFYTPEDIARQHPQHELEVATREGRYEEEGWRVRKDGSRFPANVVLVALRDGRGELVGFGKVTRDLSERKEAEQQREAVLGLEREARLHAEELAAEVREQAEQMRMQSQELEHQLDELQSQAAQLEENQVELEMANDDLQRANTRLEAAEAHYHRLVETSPYGVFVLDEQGALVEVNRAASGILGQATEAVLGRPFEELIAPQDLEVAHEVFRRVITGEDASVEVELWMTAPGGEPRLVSVVVTAIVEDGRTTGVHGVSRNITHERRAQEALQESEASHRVLFDSLAELVYIQDLEGRFLKVNEAVVERYGYSREEIIGQLPELLLDTQKTDMDEVLARFSRAAEGERQRFELWGRTRDGQSFPKELTLTRVRYFGNDVVIAVARDITERKAAERERQESEKRDRLIRTMELERTRLKAFFEEAPAFIAVLQGPDHVIEVSNALHNEMIGYRPVLRKPFSQALPELAEQGFVEVLDRAYRTGEAYIGNGSRILLQREPGGEPEERYLNFVCQPFLGPGGKVSGIFVHGVDVSDLVRARQEAESANRAKSDFLSRMSHELRTPLNSVLGFGQVLEMDLERPEDRESVDQILRAGNHLLTLIDEVLDIARIEAGQISLSVEPVSVGDLVRESVDLVRPMATNQGIIFLTADAASSDHFVLADQQRLKQVMLNLLSNAIKYNHRGGSVHVECEQLPDDRLRIRVSDSGIGIPFDRQGRLFVPFDRLGADQTTVEGTGLGLALSKGLVEAMGGEIGVASREGEGSDFWVDLQCAPPPALPQPVIVARDTEARDTGRETTHVVLFVEDNLANVRLMERVFERRPGVRLLTAMQGSLGLDLAREQRPDLILLDLNLPDMSGEKVLLQLRQDPVLRDIPVVMISGDAIPSRVQRLLELGARGYLTKPFNVHELLSLVDESLQNE